MLLKCWQRRRLENYRGVGVPVHPCACVYRYVEYTDTQYAHNLFPDRSHSPFPNVAASRSPDGTFLSLGFSHPEKVARFLWLVPEWPGQPARTLPTANAVLLIFYVSPLRPPPAHTFWCILIFRFMLKCVAFDHFVFTCVGRGQLLRKAARKSAEAYVPNSTQTTCLTWLLKGSETAEMSNWRPGMWLVLIVEESHPLIGRDSHLVKIVHPQQHSRSSEGPHCCL